jgi:AraC-like DNA-binding protein
MHLVDALDALRALGVEVRRLCRAAGIDLEALRDPEARLPSTTMVTLFREAERLTGDPFVGLHAAERAEPRGPLDYLLMSSPRLEDGIRHAERFSRLVLDTLRISLELRGDTASTVFDPGDRRLEESHHAIEYLLMASLRSARRAVGAQYRLLEVHVRHAERGGGAELARAFGCPVRFEQPDNRLVYPLDELRAASRFANPRIAEQIEKFAATLAARAAPHASLREQVAKQARELLAAGLRAHGATVARRLGISARTLQRRLREEEATFRGVRDAVLREVVEALLSNPWLKMEAVALSVGFADVAAFSKAFKRWAGCAPAQYRKRLACGPPISVAIAPMVART